MKQPEQTKEEIKDSLARSRGYYDYSDALRDFYQKDAVHEAIEFTQKWAEAYASQKCKALQEEKQVLYDGLSKSVSSVKALQEENEMLLKEVDYWKREMYGEFQKELKKDATRIHVLEEALRELLEGLKMEVGRSLMPVKRSPLVALRMNKAKKALTGSQSKD